MENMRMFKLIKTDKPKYKDQVGEEFVMVNDKIEVINILGGIGDNFGTVMLVDKKALEEDFREIDLDKEESSLVGKLFKTLLKDEDEFIKKNKENVKKGTKEPKEEVKEETQLDRIERKLDKVLKLCHID